MTVIARREADLLTFGRMYKRQLVSRLGIALPDMGFPPITCGCVNRIGTLFDHFFLQKLSHIINSQSAISRNFYILRYGHKINIA